MVKIDPYQHRERYLEWKRRKKDKDSREVLKERVFRFV